MSFAFRFLFGEDVEGDLLTFGPGWVHLRQEPARHERLPGVLPLERIVHGVPAVLHGDELRELRFSRLGLVSISMDIRVEPLLDIGRRLPLIGTKDAICF